VLRAGLELKPVEDDDMQVRMRGQDRGLARVRPLTGHLIQESGERSPSAVIPSFVLIYTVLYPVQCTLHRLTGIQS
jgi:hypothetical protein